MTRIEVTKAVVSDEDEAADQLEPQRTMSGSSEAIKAVDPIVADGCRESRTYRPSMTISEAARSLGLVDTKLVVKLSLIG